MKARKRQLLADPDAPKPRVDPHLPVTIDPSLTQKTTLPRTSLALSLPPEEPVPPTPGLGVPPMPASEQPSLRFTHAPPVKRPKPRRLMTSDPLLRQLDDLKVENFNLRMACIDLERQLYSAYERLWRARNKPAFSMAVSRFSGSASFYGLRRIPITLYYSQWKYVFDHREEILEFIRTHEVLLSD